MATLSVPLPEKLEIFINRMVKRGAASNKAEVVRQALAHYEEEVAVQTILRAQQEFRDGKEVRGDLRKLLKQFK